MNFHGKIKDVKWMISFDIENVIFLPYTYTIPTTNNLTGKLYHLVPYGVLCYVYMLSIFVIEYTKHEKVSSACIWSTWNIAILQSGRVSFVWSQKQSSFFLDKLPVIITAAIYERREYS